MDKFKQKSLKVNSNGLKNEMKFINKLHLHKPHFHQTVDTMIDSMIESYIKSKKSLSDLDKAVFEPHPCHFQRNDDSPAAIGGGGEEGLKMSPMLSQDFDDTPRSPRFLTPRQLFHNTKTRDMRVLFSRSDDSYLASPKEKRTSFNDQILYHENEVGKNDRVIVNRKDKEKNSKQSTPRKLKPTKFITDIPLIVFEKKFLFLADRILDSLNEIRLLLSNGIPPPDGEEDTQRRSTRLREFSSRFSRNTLYSLGRHMRELETPKCTTINQKMLNCYQLILNGLQAYQNHLPSSIGSAAADKITQFIQYFSKLADIHKNFTPLPDNNGVLELIQAFKMHADVIVQQLVSISNPQMKRALFTSVSTTDLNLAAKKVKSSQGQRIKTKRNSNNNIFARYSMYSGGAAFKSDNLWKKTVEYLAKKKYNVKSRYRQTNPAPVNNNAKDLKSTSTISKKASHITQIQSKSSQLYNGPNNTANENMRLLHKSHNECNSNLDEDSIETLVQQEIDEETPRIAQGQNPNGQDNENGQNNENVSNSDNNQMMVIHGKIATQLYELVQDSKLLSANNGTSLKDLNEINSEEKILQLIDDCMANEEGKLVLGKLFTELVRNSNKSPQEIDLDLLQTNNINLNLELNCCNNEVEKRKEKKALKIKETGEKNARLIIIQDENSIIDDDSIKIPIPLITKNTTETQTAVPSINKATQKASLKTIKISRLEKKCKPLKMLPKNYIVNVIQYKIDFKNHTRNNLMYKRTEKIQPVQLMNRISDEIFDFSLDVVTKEMEKMNLAQRIYRSELMY